MPTLETAYRLVRDGWENVRAAPGWRTRWQHALGEQLLGERGQEGEESRIQLGRWLSAGNDGSRVSGRITAGDCSRRVWVKQYHRASSEDVRFTQRRLELWRHYHPELAASTPAILAASPAQRCLVFESMPGCSLQQALRQPSAGGLESASQILRNLGGWLATFAWRHRIDRNALSVMVGPHCQLHADDTVRIALWPHLRKRIAQAEQAVAELSERGFADAMRWSRRFDLERLSAACQQPEAAGLTHGDLTVDNVLIDDGRCAIIDWWLAPVFGIPWADLAMLIASLRLAMPNHWQWMSQALLHGYADSQPENPATERAALTARNRTLIDLIATVWLLRMAAEATRRPRILIGSAHRSWRELIEQMVEQPLVSSDVGQ